MQKYVAVSLPKLSGVIHRNLVKIKFCNTFFFLHLGDLLIGLGFRIREMHKNSYKLSIPLNRCVADVALGHIPLITL